MTTLNARNLDKIHAPVEIKPEKLDYLTVEISESVPPDGDSSQVKEAETVSEFKKDSNECCNIERKHALISHLLRGLLPHEKEKFYAEVLSSPVLRRCCIEHSYFSERGSESRRRGSPNPPAADADTLPFENSLEQQTADVECLALQEVESESAKRSLDKNNVNGRKKKNWESSSSSSSSNSRSSEEFLTDDPNDRDYCPEDNSSGTDSETGSDLSVESGDLAKSNSNSINSSEASLKNVFPSEKKPFPRRWLEITSYPIPNRTPNNFVSVHDLIAKFRNMQELVKAKCEKTFAEESGKPGKVPPPRLKKMLARGKGEEFLKMSDYLFPMPNLIKMVNGEKNWNVEYEDDEVQSLALDDLLLKASELNAENFTKALGRKRDPAKPGFNARDSSEIVFTIPKSKRNPQEGEQPLEANADLPKPQNLKTVKIDISKPFFESEKAKENESPSVLPKSQEEEQPKRTGIKVKTVENINEEFNGSLGLKALTESVSNGVDQKTPTGDDRGKEKEAEEEERGSRGESQKTAEGSRPFIMTIIQSKAKKQRPAILRNSLCFKKKSASSEKSKAKEKNGEGTKEARGEGETLAGSSGAGEKVQDLAEPPEKGNFGGGVGSGRSEDSGRGLGSCSKVEEPEGESGKSKEAGAEGRFAVKKRNVPFVLNPGSKTRQAESFAGSSDKSKGTTSMLGGSEAAGEKTFRVTSVEQKLLPQINTRFVKVVPYDDSLRQQRRKVVLPRTMSLESQPKLSDEECEGLQKDEKTNHVVSLRAFSTILKDILPDKWILCLDKKYGLQIIKTQVDELLNPSISISVVIARCGKLTVNVRGKQLHKSHELFSDLREIANSKNKLSLNYVMAVIGKLRDMGVCFGCDDLSLKKYWSEDGFVEHRSEIHQVYRSRACHLLVSSGKKRCYPCYRMNETFKKRHRREKLEEKLREESRKEEPGGEIDPKAPQSKGVKRNLEDFLEESFSTMKQQIVDEIEKNKKLGERENALKAQEEVLSFMGLARKESLDAPLRKSKRMKNSFYKLQQPAKKKINQQELEFLEKHWADINTLFSTSMLFGAYSRTGRGRLREKCRMFHKLLSTWRNIVRSNPEWIGGEISLPEELTDGEVTPEKDSGVDQFDKMDVPALRAYIIGSVKEVNRIKHKLRTKNSYFKVLYNKFVKRRMKKPKALCSEKKESRSSPNSTTNTPTPTDFSSDESSRDKEKTIEDESRPVGDLIMTCQLDGD